VSLSNLLKQLKRRFRSRKKWLTLGAVVLALGLAALLRTAAGEPASVTMAKPDSAGSRVWQEIVGGGPRIVIEQKEYLCGVETHVIGRLSPEGLERYREANPNAAVATDQEGRVIFTERIDDLSSACRNKAYFGLDKKGNLTLFDVLFSS
jgi:forespore regulator of the sigma-K checkpoint